MPSYPGISSEVFRHPLDQEAERALRSVPGFDLIARKFVEFIYERPQLVFFMGNSIQVGPRQYASLYQIYRECLRDLDIYPEPGLFVSQNPQVNAYALGQQHPSVIVNTGLIDLLSEAEIRALLAHELGHVKCGHTILIQMGIWAMGAASILGEMTLGIGTLVSTGLIYAFYEWQRKAELSSDRAALLVTDDLDLVMQTMMQLAGGSAKYASEVSLNEFIRQSENYQELDRDNLNQVYKFLLYNGMQGTILSHPFPVDRLHHLQAWSQSEEYRQIRQGNYQRDPAQGAVNVEAETPRSQAAPENEADNLRRQIQELQEEIDRMRSRQNDRDTSD
ncbi:MAG: M48 family metallopeptidase [Hormoscilla sp. SP5CHS1]|nr:M48 family metallopeptidase [Hormoscilla sp. SP12CHS1]MBC6453066.1 M48 family metallopeptidase [Hormoscilla sp. SP5CHS1]